MVRSVTNQFLCDGRITAGARPAWRGLTRRPELGICDGSGERAAYGRGVRAQRPRRRAQGQAIGEELPGPCGVDMMLLRAAQAPALRPGAPEPGHDTVPDKIALEFSDSRQDVKQQPAAWRRRVDGLIQNDEIHAEGLKFLRQRDEVVGGAREAVELGADHEIHTPSACGGYERVERGPSLPGAAEQTIARAR